MGRQVLTKILDRTQLEGELQEVVRYFIGLGLTSCRVLFGWAWGIKYYPKPEWEDEEVELVDLTRKVREVEASGIGSVGNDDLWLKFEDVEFQFCHERDIHIHFEQPGNPHVEVFFARWEGLGYSPAEWVKTEERGPGEKVR